MSISNFISNNVFVIAIVIVILFFIIKYLISSGYFKKIGLDLSKIDLSQFQQEDDFFAVAEKPKGKTTKENPNDFFNTNHNLQGGTI